MRCPFCKDNEKLSRVIDSRATEDGFTTRRRRECLNPNCSRRFTTYERVEEMGLQVVDTKVEDQREEFNIEKIRSSLKLAFRKLEVDEEKIEELVARIESEIRSAHELEVRDEFIGGLVLRTLRKENLLAAARYASLYRVEDLEGLHKLVKTYNESKKATEEPKKDEES